MARIYVLKARENFTRAQNEEISLYNLGSRANLNQLIEIFRLVPNLLDLKKLLQNASPSRTSDSTKGK